MKSLGAHALLLLAALAAPSSAPAAMIEQSHEIFFPAQVRKQIGAYQAFPVFWWNFVVVDLLEGPEADGLARAASACAALTPLQGPVLARIECREELKGFAPALRDWSADLPLREDRPDDARVLEALRQGFARASLPLGPDGPTLIDLIRRDPLDSWRALREKAEKRIPFHLERRAGLFYEQASRRVILPFQTAFSPSDTRATHELEASFRRAFDEAGLHDRWTWLGPHASTLANESRIRQDLGVVSRVGAVLLLVAAAGIVFLGRWRLVLLMPVVLVTTGLAAGLTWLIFGSIHGLTLSFGSSVTGLCLDYGIHGAVNSEYPRTWRANLFGLLTTLVGFGVLMTSGIPLIRQLMVFSILGLTIGYGIYYILLKRYPRLLAVEPLPLRTEARRWKGAVVAVLVVAAAAGVATIRPKFDMRQFDFQDPKAAALSRWLFETLKLKPPLFRLHDAGTALGRSTEELTWAGPGHIQAESLAQYLPPTAEQRAHAATWTQDCGPLRAKLSDDERAFFAPFLATLCTSSAREPLPLAGAKPPAYLSHLAAPGGQDWITLWLPDSPEQEAAIRARYPDSSSLLELATLFPTQLGRELAWMAPLSLLLATLLLFGYHGGRVGQTVASLLPFVTGLGLVTIVFAVTGIQLTFVSLIALVMVFGFSIDYGIFATQLGSLPPGPAADRLARSVWTANGLAALLMALGFLPLVFCRHPVLTQLGTTLFFGSIGTYLGAKWGVPALTRKT